jgi:uncharacterized repeat protein (TIGR01451 family)
MSYVGLDDGPDGIDVSFYDTNAAGDFVDYNLTPTPLPRDQPHTIRFWIRFVPGGKDLVRISIDGQDAGQCFTTWKTFYQSVGQGVPITNTLQFRSTGEHMNNSLIGKGYLFDNVSITTSQASGPPSCDLEIEKQADSSTVSAGGLAGYRLTARNHGRLAARNLLLCDRIPRHTTFASADHSLRRLGNRRCLVIPRLAPGQSASFHIVLRVNANAPPGPLDNTGDITPEQPPGLLPLPVRPDLPAVPPGTSFPDIPVLDQSGKATDILPAIKKVTAVVRILRALVSPPPVTG